MNPSRDHLNRSQIIASILGIPGRDVPCGLAPPADGLSQVDQVSWLFGQLAEAEDRAILLTIVRAFVALAQARRQARGDLDAREPAPATDP